MAKKNWAQKLGDKAQMVIHGKNYAKVMKERKVAAEAKAAAAKKVVLTKDSPKKAIKTAAPAKKLRSAEDMLADAKKLEDERAKKKSAGYYDNAKKKARHYQ